MMRKIKNYSKLLLAVGLVLSSTNLLQADQAWSGSLTAANDASNENVTINGACTLAGNLTVLASTANVNITVINQNGSITSNSSSGWKLTLDARTGYSITFDLTGSYDLDLFGGTGTNFFNIYQINGGTAGQGGAVYFKLKAECMSTAKEASK